MRACLNVAAYRFVELDDVPLLRAALLARAEAGGLVGTILLAEEGLNLSLAGAPAPVRAFVDELRADPRFAEMDVKESWTDAPPFRRMLVKERAEIIRMADPNIRPRSRLAGGRAPAVDAPTLKRWLDQGADDDGREVVLLDTRNAYEVDEGTFEGALDWRLERFTDFPTALARRREELAGKRVVSFCTGGIRCEKAAILMQREGVADVVQLEGGILRYFELVGSAHYRGTCYVFDRRRAVDAALARAPLRA